MNYPKISGLTFRPLKVKGFDRYAVASDGSFWHRNGDDRWNKVLPYRTADQKVVVRLNRVGLNAGTAVLETKDL